ncbi:hypothetical protein FRC06_005604 [Ceratobasidium sp. 370]|nr:hypothetical protein FRC06_005604 [Ceratobasidium sp. 370]
MDHHTLYVDPILAEKLVRQYLDDPLELQPDTLPELYDRHLLWEGMGNTGRILSLAQPPGAADGGEDTWMIIDITVEGGHIRHMETLLPPYDQIRIDVCNTFAVTLIAALNQIIPRPRLVQASLKLDQQVYSLTMPRPYTEEMVGIVMIAQLCGRLLRQDIRSVDASTFRQSLCYFFDNVFRCKDVDTSFPWAGLTDAHGNLLTDRVDQRVTRQRFSLAVNREASPFETFPRRRSYQSALIVPGPSAPFFKELAQPRTSHTEDMLVGSSGRSVEEFEKAVLLGPYPSWSSEFADEQLQVPEALSLDEYSNLIHSVGGPESLEAQMIMMTGKHEGQRLKLDWLKDAIPVEREWLMASTDVDSLSLTTRQAPEFLEAGSYLPYPSRAQSLTNKNNLSVVVGGKDIEMHTCPNMCIMTFGANNQFRLLVFLPNNRNKVNPRMWRNIPLEEEMKDWYRLFLTALRMASSHMSDAWEHAVEKTIEALPNSYRSAGNQSTKGGGARSFVGYRIEPQILNTVFRIMRHIADTQQQFASFKDHFFHLCGINLKLANQNIHGREDENPLNYVFRMNRFVDWYAQNPNNIVVDVGLAINVHRGSAPQEARQSTLLIRHDPLRELLRPAWLKPTRDNYCHSFVISGVRAQPRKAVGAGAGILKFQAYHKDMVLTYAHRDRSTGANFTVQEALKFGHRDKFESETTSFQKLMEEAAYAGSYGIRLEFRMGPWAANRLMLVDSREILDRLVHSEVVDINANQDGVGWGWQTCHPTLSVANHKSLLSKGWSAVIKRQQRLPRLTRLSPEVALLTSVLTYWLKGLVKRPDDMSSTVEMANSLYLLDNAKDYGLPSLRSRALDDNGLQVSYVVEPDTFKILDHVDVIRPGGNRIKTSKALQVIPRPDPLISPPPSPSRPVRDPEPPWLAGSQQFVHTLLKVHLPKALWREFPVDLLVNSVAAQQLRRGPLQIHHWDKVVQPLTRYHPTKTNFSEAIDKLFPPNWTCLPTPNTYVV